MRVRICPPQLSEPRFLKALRDVVSGWTRSHYLELEPGWLARGDNSEAFLDSVWCALRMAASAEFLDVAARWIVFTHARSSGTNPSWSAYSLVLDPVWGRDSEFWFGREELKNTLEESLPDLDALIARESRLPLGNLDGEIYALTKWVRRPGLRNLDEMVINIYATLKWSCHMYSFQQVIKKLLPTLSEAEKGSLHEQACAEAKRFSGGRFLAVCTLDKVLGQLGW